MTYVLVGLASAAYQRQFKLVCHGNGRFHAAIHFENGGLSLLLSSAMIYDRGVFVFRRGSYLTPTRCHGSDL